MNHPWNVGISAAETSALIAHARREKQSMGLSDLTAREELQMAARHVALAAGLDPAAADRVVALVERDGCMAGIGKHIAEGKAAIAEKFTDAELVQAAIAKSGLPARVFARVCLLRDERTVRRWIAGDAPMPVIVREALIHYFASDSRDWADRFSAGLGMPEEGGE
jgi:hypothetical protein